MAQNGGRLTLGELDTEGVERWVDHKKAQVRTYPHKPVCESKRPHRRAMMHSCTWPFHNGSDETALVCMSTWAPRNEPALLQLFTCHVAAHCQKLIRTPQKASCTLQLHKRYW